MVLNMWSINGQNYEIRKDFYVQNEITEQECQISLRKSLKNIVSRRSLLKNLKEIDFYKNKIEVRTLIKSIYVLKSNYQNK